MATPSRWQYLIPAAILIAAALVYGWATYRSAPYKWVPVYIPFSLQAGSFKSPVFYVDFNAHYEILLSADRYPSTRELDCLLGIESEGEKDCHETPSPLSVSWQVFAGGDSVASGISEKGKFRARRTKVQRTIGMFRADPNVEYALEIHFHGNAIALQEADPHLVVSATSEGIERHLFTMFKIQMLGWFLGGIGGIWLLFSVVQFSCLAEKKQPGA